MLTYNASDMKLAAHSDASYLSEPKARSRAGGHCFLSSDSTRPHNNGAILNIAHIIKHFMTSATEAELAVLYITAREAVYLHIILEEMGHKQPPTPLQTDNAMAEAVSNGKINRNAPKQWTCVSIGCEIENANGNFAFIGVQESSIMLTIGPSIMQLYITRM